VNLFLDTNDLIYLAKGGTKLSSGQSSSFSTLGLDQLSTSGYTPVLTDTVYLEATKGVFPDAITIAQWVTQNNIQLQPTGIPPGNGGGERSIVKLLSDPNLPQFSQQPYTVLSSDQKFNWSAKNVSNVVGAVDFLNTLLSNGTTTAPSWERIPSLSARRLGAVGEGEVSPANSSPSPTSPNPPSPRLRRIRLRILSHEGEVFSMGAA
jgi:hypothetical protein